VNTTVRVPPEVSMTRDAPRGWMAEQKAPLRLPLRGGTSIQPSSKVRSANAASVSEYVPNRSSTTLFASSQVKLRGLACGRGANRSYQASFDSPNSPAFASRYERTTGNDS